MLGWAHCFLRQRWKDLTFDMSGEPKGAKRLWNVRSMEDLGASFRCIAFVCEPLKGQQATELEHEKPQQADAAHKR